MERSCGLASELGRCKFIESPEYSSVHFAHQARGAGLTIMYGRETQVGVIIVPLLVIGFGAGCIFQPTLIAMQAYSTKSRRAVIISNRNFYRCSGGACGLAISAAVLQASLRSALPAEFAYLADSTYSVPDFGGAPVPDAVLDAYMTASHSVFILQVPLMGMCLLGMLMVRDRGLGPIDDTPDTGPDAGETELVESAPRTELAVPTVQDVERTTDPAAVAGKALSAK
jgi:hypothetical protein